MALSESQSRQGLTHGCRSCTPDAYSPEAMMTSAHTHTGQLWSHTLPLFLSKVLLLRADGLYEGPLFKLAFAVERIPEVASSAAWCLFLLTSREWVEPASCYGQPGIFLCSIKSIWSLASSFPELARNPKI